MTAVTSSSLSPPATAVTATKIPIPTDSYNHSTCNRATLTSIQALMICFDTTIDSFHESIDKLSKRLDVLSERTNIIHNRLRNNQKDIHNDNDGGITEVIYPALYEQATNVKNIKKVLYRHTNALSIAKQKANDAVKKSLLHEVMKNNNNVNGNNNNNNNNNNDDDDVKPSDEWLDRPSAFEERSNCLMGIQMNTVPFLSTNKDNSVKTIINHTTNVIMNQEDGHDYDANDEITKEEIRYLKKGLDHYHEALDTFQQQGQEQNHPSQSPSNNDPFTIDYHDDNMSIISNGTAGGGIGMIGGVSSYGGLLTTPNNDSHTVISSSYTTITQQGGIHAASRRRRQRKIMMTMSSKKAISNDGDNSTANDDKIKITDTNDDNENNDNNIITSSATHRSSSLASTAIVRQQVSSSGSDSFVCDSLHDTYGIIDGHYGHVYPSVDNVHDMLVHDNKGYTTTHHDTMNSQKNVIAHSDGIKTRKGE